MAQGGEIDAPRERKNETALPCRTYAEVWTTLFAAIHPIGRVGVQKNAPLLPKKKRGVHSRLGLSPASVPAVSSRD
jgi:hypothetical protein